MCTYTAAVRAQSQSFSRSVSGGMAAAECHSLATVALSTFLALCAYGKHAGPSGDQATLKSHTLHLRLQLHANAAKGRKCAILDHTYP